MPLTLAQSRYRSDIDGLRAIAVLSVIFFHAGIDAFSGGFFGVDVFFVISGFLITGIILSDIKNEAFSFFHFYERRIRRIFPALLIVMLSSSAAGYALLMPDEYKNFGQSLIATSLFTNNILLAITSGYWSLASEFKPLLHTWSLGVEEQYYIIIPIILFWARQYKKTTEACMWAALFGSLLLAYHFAVASPDWAFYMLPARAWEILLGSLVSIYYPLTQKYTKAQSIANSIGFWGLMLILFSISCLDKSTPFLGLVTLIPTIGTVLVLIGSRPDTVIYKILGNKFIAFAGLLSYSLYLWHQPIFAFLRAYSKSPPGKIEFITTLPFIFLLSLLSWHFIEKPFRSKSKISRSQIFIIFILGSVISICTGYYLNTSYGASYRIFTPSVHQDEMDKRIYNERAYAYKLGAFSNDNRRKLLIVGNSFARDFVNITTETFNTRGFEIVYSSDLKECISANNPHPLFHQADTIIFASGNYSISCINGDIKFAKDTGKSIFYVGTKNFGYNLNWLIRLTNEERPNQYNAVPDEILQVDANMAHSIPRSNYISLMSSVLKDGKIPITDSQGRMLSTDRAHLTKYGAIYFGEHAVRHSTYSKLFE